MKKEEKEEEEEFDDDNEFSTLVIWYATVQRTIE
jgi:hypothetical protein